MYHLNTVYRHEYMCTWCLMCTVTWYINHSVVIQSLLTFSTTELLYCYFNIHSLSSIRTMLFIIAEHTVYILFNQYVFFLSTAMQFVDKCSCLTLFSCFCPDSELFILEQLNTQIANIGQIYLYVVGQLNFWVLWNTVYCYCCTLYNII